jgi:hypothetical protein
MHRPASGEICDLLHFQRESCGAGENDDVGLLILCFILL